MSGNLITEFALTLLFTFNNKKMKIKIMPKKTE
jgi:hypothetical protein